ncbi:MAG: beta-1,6-N-acetylglucosaminyltransferase [Elusimicrobiota bacterium]|nr:MAG: beta-1,6-N-acetylglucosaminyltransferase [Elusimicrobiota bacterium]
MKLAVLIQAHKDPEIIDRLIRTFEHPDISVYLSLDLKSGIDPARLDPRARLIQPQRNIYWGSFSWVESALDSFAQIERDGGYDYLMNISGQDYPVWSCARILRFLDEARGKSLVHFAELAPGGWPEAADRVEFPHYTGTSRVRLAASKAVRGVMRALGVKRGMPGGMKPYGGANWFTFSREAVAYIMDFVAANPSYVEFMRSVSIPDEVIFHTILLNSPMRGSIVNDNHRYVDWSERLPNPKLLGRGDYEAIKASGKMLCRKVDPKTSLELMDLLDAGRRDA